MHGPDFVSSLAIQLSSLAKEVFVPESMEKVRKAGTEIEESRQSRHPRLVTEWFFTALASCGHPCKTEVIQKRVRDEVSWDKALLPWRRSPMWTCMRAALQLSIRNSPLAGSDHMHYKHFMLYFLSRVAKQLASSDEFFHYFQVLRTKIARRAVKLDAEVDAKSVTKVPKFLSAGYTATIQDITTEMEEQWSVVKSQDRRVPIVSVGPYNLDVKLPKIGAYVHELLQEISSSSSQLSPSARPHPSVAFSLRSRQLPDPSIFDYNYRAQGSNNASVRRRKEVLIVFQSWVSENLEFWLDDTRPHVDLCTQLKTLIEEFWHASRACYSTYAELMSGALLTIFELWVALDRMATSLCPLLEDYTPEVEKGVFEPLLLRKHSELARLGKIKLYLDERLRNAKYGSMFGLISATSLTVRLYNRSQKSQRLMAMIEEQAKRDKQQVELKFQRLRKEYEHAMETIRDQEHDVVWVKEGPDAGSSGHSAACKRCKKFGWAMNVNIERYEEILPGSLPLRKALVYELQPAEEVVIYRDCLWFILRDILNCGTTKINSQLYGLQEFNPLKPFACIPGQNRVGLASLTKPHSVTHRHLIKITTSIDTIFHPHPLIWIPVDLMNHTGLCSKSSEKELVQSTLQREMIPHKGYDLSLATHVRAQLGKSPYSKLIDTVHNVGVPQNNVIARQSSCPVELHVSEWCAFGSMRYGPHLQLINLLRGLLSKEFDLTSTSTIVLVEQMLHEAGSPVGPFPAVLRAADVDLQKPTYVNGILQYMSEIMENVAENWKEQISACILLTITQRLFTLNKNRDTQVDARCLQLIRVIRKTGLRWLERLTDIHNVQRKMEVSSASAAEIRQRILEAALLVRAT